MSKLITSSMILTIQLSDACASIWSHTYETISGSFPKKSQLEFNSSPHNVICHNFAL